jgi:hypothetical protein
VYFLFLEWGREEGGVGEEADKSVQELEVSGIQGSGVGESV